jgi:hypothetical protein
MFAPRSGAKRIYRSSQNCVLSAVPSAFLIGRVIWSKNMRTYDPKEFVAQSKVNKLPEPGELAVAGLIKTGEDEEHIYFSSSRACTEWLPVPIGLIQSIQHLMNVACKDHQHPLVRIIFKRADEVGPEAAFFMAMLSRAQKALALTRRNAPGRSSMRASDCVVVSGQVCCISEGDGGTDLEVECTGMV